jgi:hypothetical protein
LRRASLRALRAVERDFSRQAYFYFCHFPSCFLKSSMPCRIIFSFMLSAALYSLSTALAAALAALSTALYAALAALYAALAALYAALAALYAALYALAAALTAALAAALAALAALSLGFFSHTSAAFIASKTRLSSGYFFV